MKRSYMVLFEKVAEDNWGASAPDIPGAVGAGDSLAEARTSVLAGISIQLEDLMERGLEAPPAVIASIDFNEFDPEHTQLQYVVEWLAVELPAEVYKHEDTQQAA
jgi:predicted RNase H-like HicB family nuclease